jgi:serine/threonine protein kinase
LSDSADIIQSLADISYSCPASVSSFAAVGARRVTTTEDWTNWESQIVNGIFPLLRFLGKSDHSVVFLTEAQGSANAAIKLVPADALQTELQLSRWRAAATVSHPHLTRLIDVGRCQLGGYPFDFVVMDYAEQTLAQILPHRSLTDDEVRDMLAPTLDALAFLHGKNLVHGQLKPSNFLVVNDQLKLASDAIRPAGESASGIARLSLYDPPEANNGGFSAAGDIWGLGMVIAEALTQCAPAWPDEHSETASLPATLSPAFVDIVRRCLNRNPANRPTITELEAQIKPAPQPSVVPVPRPVVRDAPSRPSATQESPKRQSFVPPMVLALVALVGLWAGLHFLRGHRNSQQLASNAAPTASQQAAAPAAASQNPNTSALDQPAQASTDVPRSVLHEEIPNVSRSARDSIRGHIKVTVRVTVDRSGEVVHETVDDPGSSKYFARVATEAARKWKFASADDQNSREWLVRFEFTRDGTTARAATPRS